MIGLVLTFIEGGVTTRGNRGGPVETETACWLPFLATAWLTELTTLAAGVKVKLGIAFIGAGESLTGTTGFSGFTEVTAGQIAIEGGFDSTVDGEPVTYQLNAIIYVLFYT